MDGMGRLFQILDEEVALFEEFLSLLREERGYLLKRSDRELHRIATRMERTLYRIRKVEELREEVVEGLTGSQGQPTLSALIEGIDGPAKERLRGYQSKLLALGEGIRELIRENDLIIDRSLGNINSAILFLKESLSSETYKPSGRIG